MPKFLAYMSLIAATVVCLSPRAEACLHTPPTYKETIGQSAQEAILIHADGVQDLILKVKVKLPRSRAKQPKQLAWIVTVPAKPTAYRITKPSIFKELFKWKGRLEREDPNIPVIGGVKSARSRGLSFGRRVQVGAYKIQPIQGSAKADAVQLNKWLTKNGFKPVEPKQLHYFLENKFTFLCIKIDLKKNRSRKLAPLQVTFPSKELYYPLKFSSHQGVFDLHLYTITKQPLSYAGSLQTLRKINFTRPPRSKPNPQQTQQDEANALLNPYDHRWNSQWRSRQLPRSVRTLLKARKTPKTRWYVNYINASKVNHGDTIGRWKQDTFFALGLTKADRDLQKLRAQARAKSKRSRRRWSSFFRRRKGALTKQVTAWLATHAPPPRPRPRAKPAKAPAKPAKAPTKPAKASVTPAPKVETQRPNLLLPAGLAAFLCLLLGLIVWRRGRA